MGGQQGKQQINPNITNNHSNPSHKPSSHNDQFILKHIRDSFRDCSINGNLSKTQFNQALAVLQTLNFKRLRDTPLADRLFVLFDKNKNNYISESDFSNGIKDVISDRQHAIEYTFRAYDIDNDNRISKKEFIQIVKDSWMTAFRLLADEVRANSLTHNQIKLSVKDYQEWAQSKISILNQEAMKVFNKYDNNKKGYLEFQGFKELVTNAGINQIKAQIDNKMVLVPLTLMELHK